MLFDTIKSFFSKMSPCVSVYPSFIIILNYWQYNIQLNSCKAITDKSVKRYEQQDNIYLNFLQVMPHHSQNSY